MPLTTKPTGPKLLFPEQILAVMSQNMFERLDAVMREIVAVEEQHRLDGSAFHTLADRFGLTEAFLALMEGELSDTATQELAVRREQFADILDKSRQKSEAQPRGKLYRKLRFGHDWI